MTQDISSALEGWDYNAGVVQTRMVQAQGGRMVLQLRVDLGILQLETTGRPDGSKPHGCATYLAYLNQQVEAAERAEQSFVLSEKDCQETDREFLQFYHRRICWLSRGNFARAIEDADHTLAFMDLVRKHAPSREYALAHERFRGLVLYHRTQARAALAVEQGDAESAIDTIHSGLEQLRTFFAAFDAEEQMDEDPMVQQLQKLDRSLRDVHKIGATLQEQLAQAVANEEYETAARLRDKLRDRQH